MKGGEHMAATWTLIHPERADFAFPNSLKGQRGCILPGQTYTADAAKEPYVRLVKSYFFWNELERTRKDGADYIRGVTNERFAGCMEKNIRYIPRIAIEWPNHGDTWQATRVSAHYASDMQPSTLDTPEFFARVRDFVLKLGDAWDEDPRIAYMETGIYGLWGEQHEDFMSPKAQRNLAEAFLKAFPHKKCMVRYPRECVGYGFGTYWDSFAHKSEENLAHDAIAFMDWTKGVMGGEVAHNWGETLIQPGKDMNDTLSNPAHKGHFLDYVRWQHNNHLGMRLQTDDRYEAALQGLSEYQMRAGFRLTPEEVRYRAENGRLEIYVRLVNEGSSPMYYDWPLAAALLDARRRVVFQGVLPDVRLSKVLPGDDFHFETGAYRIAPKSHAFEGAFTLPPLALGAYTVALSVLDPYCMRPNVLLATRQYFRGGWHPMGRLGIGCEIPCETLTGDEFDDMRADETLSYAREGRNAR